MNYYEYLDAKKERENLEQLRNEGKLERFSKDWYKSFGIIRVDKTGDVIMFTRLNKNIKAGKPYLVTSKKKYGKTMCYKILNIWDKFQNKSISVPVSRLVWTWYNGKIPDGFEVDHIDNNTMNNNLYNLQILSKKENLQKKDIGRNQYTAGMSKEEILKLRAKREEEKKKIK